MANPRGDNRGRNAGISDHDVIIRPHHDGRINEHRLTNEHGSLCGWQHNSREAWCDDVGGVHKTPKMRSKIIVDRVVIGWHRPPANNVVTTPPTHPCGPP